MTSELTSSAYVYHRRKDGALRHYDRKTTKVILVAAVRGETSVSSRELLGSPVFNLETMKEGSWSSTEEEDIVVEVPWSAESLRAAEALSGKPSIRRKILEMAICRISEQQSLSKILDSKKVPERTIRPNPYLGRCHQPFDTFVSSLENDTSGQRLYDAALQLASDPTDSGVRLLEQNGLFIVFHGTSYSVMDNILKTGLLPEFRQEGRTEDWFGPTYETSLKYTRSRNQLSRSDISGCKLLLFMVLHPTGGMTSSVSGNQLPLAELTLLSSSNRRRV
ncbi:hypothetical protein Mapa_002330 [Marchantia paleacea]|nr:hypothetical protein Mapa_002330 [Marchantia paleacea]